MTDTALYTANTPVVSVGGTERPELARDLVRLDVEEGVEGLRTLVLRLSAVPPYADGSILDWAYLDGQVVDFGSTVSVAFGPTGTRATVFEGSVSALELVLPDGGVPHVAVHAEDALMALRMTRRSRTYEQVTDAEVVEAVAREHGLRADASADGPTYPVVQQWDQSDLAFLRDRARRIDAQLWFADGTVHFASRPQRTAPAVTLVYGNDLLEAQIRADLAHQRTTVRMTGFDLDRQRAIDEQAPASTITRETTGGRTGPDVLAQAFGERVTSRSRGVPTTGEQARAAADAEMLRRSRAFVVADGVTSGSPTLTVGSPLRLDRAGAPFSGKGYVTTWVHHSFDPATGSRTRFRAERATVS